MHKIPLPSPKYITGRKARGFQPVEGTLPRREGDRLAASYINFVFCNGGAIVPIFGDRNDDLALATLQNLMPERKIMGVYAREILLGGNIQLHHAAAAENM